MLEEEPRTYTGDPRSKDVDSNSIYKGRIRKGNWNGGERINMERGECKVSSLNPFGRTVGCL